MHGFRSYPQTPVTVLLSKDLSPHYYITISNPILFPQTCYLSTCFVPLSSWLCPRPCCYQQPQPQPQHYFIFNHLPHFQSHFFSCSFLKHSAYSHLRALEFSCSFGLECSFFMYLHNSLLQFESSGLPAQYHFLGRPLLTFLFKISALLPIGLLITSAFFIFLQRIFFFLSRLHTQCRAPCGA